MKKSALVIVIMLTVVACLSLTACNSSTPQGQLGNYFAPYEKFVYDVAHTTEEGVISGKYTIEIEQFDGGDITVGDVLVKKQPSGHVINTSKSTTPQAERNTRLPKTASQKRRERLN